MIEHRIPPEVQKLIDYIEETYPDRTGSYCPPYGTGNVWWIDVDGVPEFTLAWYPEIGYALSVSDVLSYGENPDEMGLTLDEVKDKLAKIIEG